MTFQPEAVQAAVFDIGGVFTYPDYRPVAEKLTELGVPQPTDLTEFRRAHHAGVLALTKLAGTPREHVPDFWVDYDVAYASTLGVAQDQVNSFRIAVRNTWSWVHDENVASFHRLAETGIPLAIVSNNDGTAPEQMRDFGVCQVGAGPLPEVAAIVDSTLEGVAKPDPAIFMPAIDALAIDPQAVVYVGDTVHADVHGAINAGMQVVQLDPFDHHTDFEHSRMRDLDQLIDALGR